MGFTLKRGDFRSEENNYLATQFAEWFGAITGKFIGGMEESFCIALDDGTVLCRVIERVEGSEIGQAGSPSLYRTVCPIFFTVKMPDEVSQIHSLNRSSPINARGEFCAPPPI